MPDKKEGERTGEKGIDEENAKKMPQKGKMPRKKEGERTGSVGREEEKRPTKKQDIIKLSSSTA